MNKEAFLQIADIIDGNLRFNLGYFVHNLNNPEIAIGTGSLVHDTCGTVGCIAGWTAAVAGFDIEKSYEIRICALACDYLGITDLEGERLFFAVDRSVWHEQVEYYGWETDRYGSLSNWSQITGKQAADVLRRIVDGDIEL